MITERALLIFLLLALAVGGTRAAHAQGVGNDPNLANPTQVVTAKRDGYTIAGLVTHLEGAKAFKYGVALFPGHPGIMRLREEGGGPKFELGGNFLVRSRRQWLDEETLVVVVDAPSDEWASFSQRFRETPRYGADVEALLSRARPQVRHRGLDVRRHERRLNQRVPCWSHEPGARQTGDPDCVGDARGPQWARTLGCRLLTTEIEAALGQSRGRPLRVHALRTGERRGAAQRRAAGDRTRRRACARGCLRGVYRSRVRRRGKGSRAGDAVVDQDRAQCHRTLPPGK